MNLSINNNIFKCKVVVSQDAIEKGMMGKNFNYYFDAMLFMMPERQEQNFWMYKCIVPLDIIMIDNNVITKINHNCLPCDDVNGCEYYSGFGDMVLEVAGETCKNLGIKEGDMINTSMY